MTSVWLDGSNISSMQKLSVLTGEADTWLFIYSGLAKVQEYDQAGLWSGGRSSNPTVNIKLDTLPGVLLEYACTASLANITGGSVGQWAIESDSLTLQDNGDLVLATTLRVFAGDSSWEELDTYSYYVSAKIRLDSAKISGTVRWRKAVAQPASPPLFAVTANSEVPPSSPGSFGTSRVEATGVEGPVDSSDPNYYYVPYAITGALLGKTVFVYVAPIPAKFIGPPSGDVPIVNQISGPAQMTISNSNLHVSNVDFEIIFEAIT